MAVIAMVREWLHCLTKLILFVYRRVTSVPFTRGGYTTGSYGGRVCNVQVFIRGDSTRAGEIRAGEISHAFCSANLQLISQASANLQLSSQAEDYTREGQDNGDDKGTEDDKYTEDDKNTEDNKDTEDDEDTEDDKDTEGNEHDKGTEDNDKDAEEEEEANYTLYCNSQQACPLLIWDCDSDGTDKDINPTQDLDETRLLTDLHTDQNQTLPLDLDETLPYDETSFSPIPELKCKLPVQHDSQRLAITSLDFNNPTPKSPSDSHQTNAILSPAETSTLDLNQPPPKRKRLQLHTATYLKTTYTLQ
jgi:hypothetical protein